MRHIGNLPNAPQAQLFRDYLYARGIRNEIELDSDSSWMVWVLAEDQLDAARELLEKFRKEPSAPEFVRKAESAEQMRARQAGEEAAYRKRFFTRQRIFGDTRPFGAGALTYVLIVACVVVALISNLGSNRAFLQHLFISWPETGGDGFLPEVRAGQVWRLFTPVLIHFGPVHLIFNMLWLFQLGNLIEGRQGHLHFACLVLGLAVASNIAQYVYGGPSFGGMSGVVYGLFGYVWLRGRLDPASGMFMDGQTVVLMIVWFVACFAGLVGPVANGAHGAGLVLGAGYGIISALLARRNAG